jgi:dTDP-glucose 4,6-dehydratase
VLKAFEAQADRGGPITVTHPDVTRYFMTITEASRLTIYAGAIGDPGEVMILDMGEPVRIVEVAERFANRHDPPLEIEFTGLRPNEKLHEDLISVSELGERRIHKMITHVSVTPLEPIALMSGGGPAPTVDEMRAIALSGAHDAEPLDSDALDPDPLDVAPLDARPLDA